MQHNKQPINKTFNGFSDHLPQGFNPDDYKDDLADFDLNEEQKKELLQVLWDITYQFAIMGFGMESTQIVLNDLFKNIEQESSKEVQQISAINNTNDNIKEDENSHEE